MFAQWNAVTTLDRIFDDVMGSAVGTATSARSFGPSIDVRTTQDEVVFVCDVPGVRQDDLDITLENHVLTIRGARKFEGKENEHVLLGRTYGSFARSFSLPDDLDDEKLDAQLADGVLTIRVPRLPKAKPRKIAIGGRPSGERDKQLGSGG